MGTPGTPLRDAQVCALRCVPGRCRDRLPVPAAPGFPVADPACPGSASPAGHSGRRAVALSARTALSAATAGTGLLLGLELLCCFVGRFRK